MDAAAADALTRNGTIDITTIGNKTGEARRIEIMFHAVDGRVYISGYPRPQKRHWLRNLEAHPGFTFHLKESVKADLPATARPINDPAERRKVLATVGKTWNLDIDTMVEQSPLVEVTFDG